MENLVVEMEKKIAAEMETQTESKPALRLAAGLAQLPPTETYYDKLMRQVCLRALCACVSATPASRVQKQESARAKGESAADDSTAATRADAQRE